MSAGPHLLAEYRNSTPSEQIATRAAIRAYQTKLCRELAAINDLLNLMEQACPSEPDPSCTPRS